MNRALKLVSPKKVEYEFLMKTNLIQKMKKRMDENTEHVEKEMEIEKVQALSPSSTAGSSENFPTIFTEARMKQCWEQFDHPWGEVEMKEGEAS